MDKQLKGKIVSWVAPIVCLILFASVVSAGLDEFSTPLHLAEVGVDSTEYGGVEYTNWTHDFICLGWTYDSGYEISANADVDDFYMVIQFEKTDIQPGDVILQYWNGTAWSGCSFDIGEEVLTYTFPESHLSISKGDVLVIPILVTFHQTGTFTSRIWAEGLG
jgi:hypothetical protein